MKSRKTGNLLLFLLVLLCAGGCAVPNNAYLMELNRNGKWNVAEKVGLGMLKNKHTFSHSQIRETFFQVIYAKTRMGKKDEAVALMKEYVLFSAGGETDPEYWWLDRETIMLKKELGMLDEIQKVLVRAMEENGNRNYEYARELCMDALEMPGIHNSQKAVACFVASVCSVRLGDVEAAEGHLASYRKYRSALHPGHQVLSEEKYLEQGLAELKAEKSKQE
ncbi:MAG: hypothetical protein JW874_13630 [Spirochaetales bacterium]|nr:hypothetical protein [Spirochaetales bacterium]